MRDIWISSNTIRIHVFWPLTQRPLYVVSKSFLVAYTPPASIVNILIESVRGFEISTYITRLMHIWHWPLTPRWYQQPDQFYLCTIDNRCAKWNTVLAPSVCPEPYLRLWKGVHGIAYPFKYFEKYPISMKYHQISPKFRKICITVSLKYILWFCTKECHIPFIIWPISLKTLPGPQIALSFGQIWCSLV